MVQWLGLCFFTAKGTGSSPGGETKMLQATQGGQKKKKIAFGLHSKNKMRVEWITWTRSEVMS